MVDHRTLDPGEELFERYLTENGYSFEHEPDFGIAKHPDYWVQRAGTAVVCEVKSFLVPRDPRQHDAMTPIRRKIGDAAPQLKPLADSGLPLVVVLSLSDNSPTLLSATMVLSAMYGDLTPESGKELAFGRGGKLRNDHPYVSALAVLHREPLSMDPLIRLYDPFRRPSAADAATALEQLAKLDQENADRVRLDVYETANGAPRLPRDVFNGSHDHRWAPDKTGSRIVQIM
jgi:hypothetical protein